MFLNKKVCPSKISIFRRFSSVQMLSCVRLFVTPWTAACQASLSITISWSLLKLMSIKSVMPSNHLILCRPLLLLPSIFTSIRVFSNESVLWNPMNCSTPGLPVHHHLLEFAQTHVHWVSDAIQPSRPLLSPSPPSLWARIILLAWCGNTGYPHANRKSWLADIYIMNE